MNRARVSLDIAAARAEAELLQLCRSHLGCDAPLAELAASIVLVFADDQTSTHAPEAITRDTLAAWGAPLSAAAWNMLRPFLGAARNFIADAWAAEANEGDGWDDWRELPKLGEAVTVDARRAA